jgi:hypothetical protein
MFHQRQLMGAGLPAAGSKPGLKFWGQHDRNKTCTRWKRRVLFGC